LYESEADDAEIRLVDFGFARMKPANRGLTTPCFTLHYAAPEVLRHALKPTNQTTAVDYDESCDLWSLGVVLVHASIMYFDVDYVTDYHCHFLDQELISYRYSSCCCCCWGDCLQKCLKLYVVSNQIGTKFVRIVLQLNEH